MNQSTFEQAINAIKELDSLLGKLGIDIQNINELAVQSTYLKPQDVAEKMGISPASAREYMSRPDFPAIRYGESGDRLLVNSVALFMYNMTHTNAKRS